MNQIGNLVRQEVIQTARTVVVKVGTNVLSLDDDTLDIERIELLSGQLHKIRQTGRKVVLVSSGAIGAGMGLLSLKKRPEDLPHLQAAAATGQARLIHVYDECFQRHGYHAAQLLLTINDFKSRKRYLNVKNTLSTLFEYGVIPIVNENDTVSIDEIKFGDNDRLAALVTNLMPSPLLVILSNIQGLYDRDPSEEGSKLIPLVQKWDEDLLGYAAAVKSTRGTGGMQSKLQAIQTATAVGENVILANGRDPQVLDKVLAGEEVGTLFLAEGQTIPAWKRWIGYTITPKGKFVLDEGACRALRESGRSLLAIGVVQVSGHFDQGEVVSLVDPQGHEFARGLTNYNSEQVQMIAGKRTPEIEQILGSIPYVEIIHRDNLVVMSNP
ncbi:Glutamate 5-kinase [Polystyrenella longa]|uniref:Glutamate 5-kinase n=1 Tax=Polystyrenella longa TaxID=2528007 RepID=A0A518CP62_9PLAN|nr:glutamate 5-kinase [Polystyrenella longa]QDU81011.1 Glutamate 5-kinase [Polystyrenella longa]